MFILLHYVVCGSTGTLQANAPSGCECPYPFMFSVDNFKTPKRAGNAHLYP